MLTKNDFKKIAEMFRSETTNLRSETVNLFRTELGAFKELFYTKSEIDEKFSTLQTSVDAIAKNMVTYQQESTILGDRLKNTENWIDQAAPRLNIKFER